MILPKQLITFFLVSFCFIFPSYSNPGEFKQIEADTYEYTTGLGKYGFDSQGNLKNYTLISKNYQKTFLYKNAKPTEEKPKFDPNHLMGVQFGFLNRKDVKFVHLSTNVDQNANKIEFTLEDQDKSSASYGLQIKKSYTFLKEAFQFKFQLELINPTERNLSLYPNMDVEKTLGIWMGSTMSAGYWTELAGGPASNIDSIKFDTKFTDHTPEDGLEFLALRGSYFLFGLKGENLSKVFTHKMDLEVPKGEEDSSRMLVNLFIPLVDDSLKPGSTLKREMDFYWGEKRVETMEESQFSPVFNKYGSILGGIERAMFFVLTKFYQITGSFGWSIILLTFLVKLLLLPINLKQTRSMAKMQEISPLMKELQAKYADDKQKLNMEMMKLYQTHQVNPVAGCLPMILQIPIFFSLFYTVGGSVEMYGEQWFWVKNLAFPDPTRLLPLLFVVSFVVSQRKMMQDPNQRMMMMIMPIMFFFMMQQLSAGVMLYIVGQNVVTLVEQGITQMQKKKENESVEVIPKESKSKGNKKKNKHKKKATSNS